LFGATGKMFLSLMILRA